MIRNSQLTNTKLIESAVLPGRSRSTRSIQECPNRRQKRRKRARGKGRNSERDRERERDRVEYLTEENRAQQKGHTRH